MPKFKAVATDNDKFPINVEAEILEEMGVEVVRAVCRTEQEIIAACRDADVILNVAAQMTRSVIEKLEKCRVIIRYGVGLDNVDVPACTEHGIIVAHVPDFCWDEVADTAMSHILAVTRKVVKTTNDIRSGVWNRNLVKPIHKYRGSRLGLVSFGNIARAVAKRAKAFGFEVVAYDPYLTDAVFRANDVESVGFEELLTTSDIISVHSPLTDETRGMFGEAEFRKMKKTAYFINTGRGPVVQNAALYKALKEGWIAGAGLDVMEVEPAPKDEPLLTLENITLTPHYASYTEEAYHELQVKVGRQAAQVLRGEWPTYFANPQVKEKYLSRGFRMK
ncbi:MAG: C-terminal binding protein [Planctomycetota bacterium]